MQKFHPIIAWVVLILFIVHLAMGCVTLLTSVFLVQGHFAYVFMGFVCLHGVLALWKVVRGGAWRAMLRYPKENGRYWLRVLSGAAILFLALQHTQLFTIRTPFGVLLRPFGTPSLLWQLALSAALAVHVLLNLRPLLLDSGIDPDARAQRWVRAVSALALLVAAAGAVCYVAGVKL